MVNVCVVFSYVVTIVGRPRSPVMAKLLLRFSASQQVETHVHGFGPPWVDGVVDNYEGRGVVGLHYRRWLRMYHRNERVAGGDGFTEIDIEGAKISLGGGRHDGFDDLGDSEDSPIVGRVAGFIGEGKMAADTDAHLGF